MPYRLRYQLAWNHGLSRAVLQVYTRVLLDMDARGTRARGVPGGRTGSVTVPQRSGRALNTILHFHNLVLDGVFTRSPGGALAFHPALRGRDGGPSCLQGEVTFTLIRPAACWLKAAVRQHRMPSPRRTLAASSREARGLADRRRKDARVGYAQAPRGTPSRTLRAGTSLGHFTIKRPFIPSLK